MLPTTKKTKVQHVRSALYTEEVVKEQLPFIRKKVFKTNEINKTSQET